MGFPSNGRRHKSFQPRPVKTKSDFGKVTFSSKSEFDFCSKFEELFPQFLEKGGAFVKKSKNSVFTPGSKVINYFFYYHPSVEVNRVKWKPDLCVSIFSSFCIDSILYMLPLSLDRCLYRGSEVYQYRFFLEFKGSLREGSYVLDKKFLQKMDSVYHHFEGRTIFISLAKREIKVCVDGRYLKFIPQRNFFNLLSNCK